MRALKKILFLNIIIALFILSSCGTKTTAGEKGAAYQDIAPTPDLIFCANAMYDSKEDIPDACLIYCCYNEAYKGNVEIAFLFGKPTEIHYELGGGIERLISDEEVLDTTHNVFSLYLVDDNNGKIISLDDKMYTRPATVIDYCLNKYIVSFWSYAKQNRCSIPMEYFNSKTGELYISVFQRNKKTGDELSLITITIEYIKDDDGIKIIAPDGSFSGKGLKEGKTVEEIFREA